MNEAVLDSQVLEVRAFNRFFTSKIGVLREGLLDSPFSLTEARIIYELAQTEAGSATVLCDELGVDPGYLSRLLARFERRGLIARETASGDNRRRLLRLTEAGRKAFADLDERSRFETAKLLERLSASERPRLVEAMRSIAAILGDNGALPSAFLLRDLRPGELGWVVERHGAVYAREYGWDSSFEALVARIVADYAADHDPSKERCWIADLDGRPVGCVFVVRVDAETAKLRLLLVEPEARGRGLGRRLVEECIRFSRMQGYRKLALWTNDVLVAARAIYAEAGFSLVATEAHVIFGKPLVSETWELELTSPDRNRS